MAASEEGSKRSRGEVLTAAGLPVPFPDADHPIIETAGDLGWCMSGGMGPVALSSGEIRAWCEGMGEALTPWEFSTIRRMSAAFVAGTQADRAPYQPTIVRMALATASFS